MLNYFRKAFAPLAIVALLLTSTPALSYAKEKDVNKHEDKKEMHENMSDKSCFRAFGHLIAPGFIKKHGQVSFFGDCFLPFGIGKKIGGNHGSTTPDTIAPVITNVMSNPRATSAAITWQTDERSSSTVYLSLISPVSTSTASTTVQGPFARDHRVVVNGLTPNTVYHFLVSSHDAAGNTAISSENTFTTLASTTPIDTTGPIMTNVALLVGSSTIKVSWNTNEPATSRVYYGTSSTLDVNSSTTSFVEDTTLTQNHLITLNGLATSTTYFLAVQSHDASGNLTTTPVFSSTTSL